MMQDFTEKIQSLREKMTSISARRQQAGDKVVEFSKTLVLVLKDAGRPETALELDARLSCMEMISAEYAELFRESDPAVIIEYFKNALGVQRR